MKRILFLTLIAVFFASFAASADESGASTTVSPRPTALQIHARQVDDPLVMASDLPTVSKFQMPGIVPNIGCMDPTSGQPCVDDGGGGYTQGGCNCGRLCGNGSGCLLSVSNNGCAANYYPEACKSCSGQCYNP